MKLAKIAMKQVSVMPGYTVSWYICMYIVYPPYLGLFCLLHPRLDVVTASLFYPPTCIYLSLPLFTLSTSTYFGVPHLHGIAFNRYLPVFTSFTPLHVFTCSIMLPLFTYMDHTGVHLCYAPIWKFHPYNFLSVEIRFGLNHTTTSSWRTFLSVYILVLLLSICGCSWLF